LYETGVEEKEAKSKKIVGALHQILKPFLLRKVKSEVEIRVRLGGG
jgi:SWI/SNF-related matrix-associated actin-dependent regulator of chromatin subfamily A member 5